MGNFIPGLRRIYPPHEYISAILLVVGLILVILDDAHTSPNFSGKLPGKSSCLVARFLDFDSKVSFNPSRRKNLKELKAEVTKFRANYAELEGIAEQYARLETIVEQMRMSQQGQSKPTNEQHPARSSSPYHEA
ncbi:hypothetical protein CASFOL_037321 [Castilleja foliolosa]|uniref:Uncharacterized protein n=1 Tax=Castilleja foliolosa TaxID=1961234 RepID=A0ABD3BNL1_9LAMI